MSNTEELTQKHLKRNFITHWADGAFWGSGFAALGLFTIFPGLLHELAVQAPSIKPWENRLATLAGICFFGVSQLFNFTMVGFFESRTHRKSLLLICALIARIGIMIVAGATLLLAMDLVGNITYLALVFLGLIWYGIFSGVTFPLWYDFYCRQIPVNRRGVLFGLRESTGTVLSIGILALFPLFSKMFSFPWPYVIMYSCSVFFFMCSFTSLFFLKEIPYEAHQVTKPKPIVQQLAQTLRIFNEDKPFARLLIVMSVLSLSGLTNLSIISLKAMNTLGMSAESTGKFSGLVTIVFTVCGSVSILIHGYVGDKFSNKKVGYICYGTMIVAIVVAFFAHAQPSFIVSVALSALAGGAATIFYMTFPLEFMPEDRRQSYMVLRSLFAIPFIGTPFIGGWIADTFGSNVVFVVSIIFAIAGLFLLKTMIHDPRKSIQPAIEN